MKPLWYIVGGLAVLILLVPLAVSIGVNSFLRSPAFLELVAAETGTATQSEANFSPIQWSGASAYSERAALTGREGSAVQNLEARQVRAAVDWRAIFQGAWRIDEVEIASLSGTFVEPAPAPPVRKSAPAKSGWLPNRFELGGARIADADLRIGPVLIEDTKLEIRPDGRGWSFSGQGGRLAVPGLPVFLITDFRARTQGGDFYVTQGNLRLGANGKINVSGGTNDRRLRASWTGVDVSALPAFPGSGHVFGTLDGEAAASPGESSGRLKLVDGRIENVPVLNLIADFTRTPSFRRMPVQEWSADFRHTAEGWDFRGMVLESRGLLRMEGDVRVGNDRTLGGTFRVGVAPDTLRLMPGSRERVFTEERDGYVWTTLTVGGTLDQPVEDLSGRIANAMGQSLIDTGTSIIENVPARAIDQARDILDNLFPSGR